MYLRRRAGFSAGYLQPPAGEQGGGRSFVCELTVGGRIDPQTGMVVNIKDVDAVLKSCVIAKLDGKMLDRDVDDLQNVPPTPENLAALIWRACGPALPAASTLARVTVWATPTLRAEVSRLSAGQGAGQNLMFTVTRTYDFSASHRLHSAHLSDAENIDIFGKCNWPNGHGHNYLVEVTLAGTPEARTGQIASLDALDRVVQNEILTPYDHRHLNYDAPEFAELNPTSENLTKVIWDKLLPCLTPNVIGKARLFKVVVRETERNYFEYYGE